MTWNFVRIYLMLQRIEDSSKVESPVMRNDKAIEDFATRLIYKEMARFSQQFNQNLETPGCFVELSSPSISEAKKKNKNQLEPECIVSFSPCQTSGECQTRSYAILKKSSMNKHAQQISAAKTNVLNNQPSKYPQLQNWICLSLIWGWWWSVFHRTYRM